jgi:hypothetical protein
MRKATSVVTGRWAGCRSRPGSTPEVGNLGRRLFQLSAGRSQAVGERAASSATANIPNTFIKTV